MDDTCFNDITCYRTGDPITTASVKAWCKTSALSTFTRKEEPQLSILDFSTAGTIVARFKIKLFYRSSPVIYDSGQITAISFSYQNFSCPITVNALMELEFLVHYFSFLKNNIYNLL